MEKGTQAAEPVRKRRGFVHSTFGHIVIGILVAALTGLCVWGAMALFNSRDVEAARKAASTELADARNKEAVASRKFAIREAQVRLYESAIELERRDFGDANSKLREAGGVLDTLSKTSGAGGDVRVSRLQQSIAALDVSVGMDVTAQREQVLKLAQEAGGLLDTGQ